MRRAIRWAWLVFLAAIMTTVLPPARGVTDAATDAAAQNVNAGYLENVTFERLPGKERVTLAVSKQSGVKVENLPGNMVQVSMENLFVPEGLRRPLSDAALANVLRVTPVQKTAEGRSWVVATIDLKQKVPYSVRQEGMNILIDFNVTSVAAAEPVLEKLPPVAQIPAAQVTDKPATPGVAVTKEVAGDAGKEKKIDGPPRVSIDVQDADIKHVLRLLSELGKVNIVSGADVKGTVTLSMKDVPWDQALDTILGINGLNKLPKDNVIMVISRDNFLKLKIDEDLLEKQKKKKRDEELITRIVPIKYRLLKLVATSKLTITGTARVAARSLTDSSSSQRSKEGLAAVSGQSTETSKVAFEGAGDFFALLSSRLSLDELGNQRGWIGADADTNSVIITATKEDVYAIMDMIDKIDIPIEQILIKANIVETTKSTARNLGVQWGGMWGQKVGSQGLYITPGGTGGSTTPPGSAFSGGYSPTSGSAGVAGQGYGVNFPAASLGGGTAALGMMFGTIGENILEVQLSALQKDGKLNILSSPSLMALDNQPAYTENGDEVPFTTPGSGNNPPTVAWKKAGLRLEITPHVIDKKTIKMTILVKKDELDFSRQVSGNPVVIQKETKTELVVLNGDTIVISGLTKQKTDNSVNGVPWLKEIPGLGWLFKGETKSESMEEVMIFITPTIMKSLEVTGIQTGP